MHCIRRCVCMSARANADTHARTPNLRELISDKNKLRLFIRNANNNNNKWRLCPFRMYKYMYSIVCIFQHSPHCTVRKSFQLSIQRWFDIIVRIEANRWIELLVYQFSLHGRHIFSYLILFFIYLFFLVQFRVGTTRFCNWNKYE